MSGTKLAACASQHRHAPVHEPSPALTQARGSAMGLPPAASPLLLQYCSGSCSREMNFFCLLLPEVVPAVGSQRHGPAPSATVWLAG
jgi:hypothetical protein